MGTFNNNSTWGKILNIVITVLPEVTNHPFCFYIKMPPLDKKTGMK